jgi:hypothetical protein
VEEAGLLHYRPFTNSHDSFLIIAISAIPYVIIRSFKTSSTSLADFTTVPDMLGRSVQLSSWMSIRQFSNCLHHFLIFCALVNLLKTKRNLLYTRNQSVPRCKHFQSRLYKTSQLMIYKTKFVLCSEILTKHPTQSEHHVEFLNVKPAGT